MLEEIPTRSKVFIDSNIFIYHFLDLSDACSHLLERAERREIRAYSTTLVLRAPRYFPWVNLRGTKTISLNWPDLNPFNVSRRSELTSLYKYLGMINAWLIHVDLQRYLHKCTPRLLRNDPLVRPYVFSSSYQNPQVSYDLFDHEAYIISHQ